MSHDNSPGPGPAEGSGKPEADLLPVLEGYWEALLRGEQADTDPWLDRHPEGADGLPDLRLLTALAAARRVLGEDSRLEPPGAAGSPADAGRAPEYALPAGTLLGECRIEEWLGGGGMGEVYRAFHTRLKRPVALKVLPAGRMADPAAVARFQREMEAVGRLSHPHIVRATHAGEAGGVHFLVMDLIEGVDLAGLVKRDGPLPVLRACRLVGQAAEALQYAHEQGVIHRDVKPSNLMLTGNGELRVLDFGLARLWEEGPAAEGLTGTNAGLGTADYMAPEQGLDPRTASARSDLYSLGCTLYFLLAGQPPFPGPRYDTWGKKVRAHEREPVPPIADRRPDVPADLAALLHRLLAKDPADRPAAAGEVAGRLQAVEQGLGAQPEAPTAGWVDPRPAGAVGAEGRPGAGRSRRRLLLGAGAALVLLAAGVVGYLLTRPRPVPEGAPAGYAGWIDVRVWSKAEDDRRHDLGLKDDGALPLQPGDTFRIEARMDPPAYLYVFWINAAGKAEPVYPWQPGDWGTRPSREEKKGRLSRPEKADNGWPVPGAGEGMETVVLLARDAPLRLSDEELQRLLAGLPAQRKLKSEAAAAWFEDGEMVRQGVRGPSRGWAEVAIDSPVLRVQRLLRERLLPLGAVRAVCFAKKGN
jgi:hypothetical protein